MKPRAYNVRVLKSVFSRLFLTATLLVLAHSSLSAQTSPDPSADQALDAHQKSGGGRVILVLPFDNRSGNPTLGWIGDSFPDTLNQRLSSAGFLTLTRDDRLYALDHLGLPVDFRPTRATTIRIAQTLDADYVVVGSYTFANNHINVQAQVLEVNRLHLSAPLQDSSELGRLFDVENAIAWKIARQIDPHFAVAEQTFLSASGGITLTAFENYIRGIDGTTPTDRAKHLESAVHDDPAYAAAELALGKELYADREYDQAASVLARVPPGERQALEANFFLGLARFNTAKYGEAEEAFAFVATRLPLPEVVNDEGVALDRQGKNAAALFQRAVDADPNDPDYHYNLAVVDLRKGDFAGALRNVDQTLKLKPADNEAAELRVVISAGRSAAAHPTGFEPTTRIRRTFSEASYRQAAFQVEQMRALRIATLPPDRQADEYTQIGRDDLAQDLLPEAEQQFNAAVAANPNNAAAHAGLAQVREESGNLDDARAEASAAIRIQPSVDAYLVLARIDLQKSDFAAAAAEVRKALQLEPANAAAVNLRTQLIQHGQSFQ